MTRNPVKHFSGFAGGLVLCAVMAVQVVAGADLKALLVTGSDPHGHKWKETTPILESLLAGSGKFDVEIVKLSTTNEALAFAPDFGRYSVVVLYANGLNWSEATRGRLAQYVENGGGLVVVHNAVGQFTGWEAYRAMIGIGPGNRNYGIRLRYDEEKQAVVQVPAGEGVGGNGHGRQHEWVVKTRDAGHPIMAGLPKAWKHSADELYHGFRGKPEHVKNVQVLATAFSSRETGGTGEHEPVIITNPYGKGRVFQTMLGHSKVSMSCAGFQTIILRGLEWAATGKVTLTEVSADFPAEDKVSVRVPAASAPAAASGKIVFIGGLHTHGPGAHENVKDAGLLKSLVDSAENARGISTVLYTDKLPDDLGVLDGAAAIVLSWEGWEQHVISRKQAAFMDKLGALMRQGAGLVCLHSATAVEDAAEKEFMKWCGGNKKKGYSLHKMEKDVKVLVTAPEHPVCRGVGAIEFASEEFYRKILFNESAGRITPVLAVGQPGAEPRDNVVAWAFERAGGGRAFGCTGPHFHDSFKNEHFRRLILNAIIWSANRDVPEGGVRCGGKEMIK